MDCLFCKIINKEIPAEIIDEDEKTMAILDVHPCSAGHSLILPKKHYENILDLPEEEIGPVFTAVKRITQLLQKSLKPMGFTIGINHGKISGQAIDHLHIHIIPRYQDDGGGSIHSVVHSSFGESLEEIQGRINQYRFSEKM